MDHRKSLAEFKAQYFEFDLEVEYEVFPPVYGSVEPNSGGLYLGGPPSLPEQIEIYKVMAIGPNGKKVDITELMTEGDFIALEDEISPPNKD